MEHQGQSATSFRSLVDAIAKFEGQGYLDDFRAEPEGLRATTTGRLYDPATLKVDDRARIETESDPDSQVMVLALRDPKEEVKGIYTVTFGPNMDPLDARALQTLG